MGVEFWVGRATETSVLVSSFGAAPRFLRARGLRQSCDQPSVCPKPKTNKKECVRRTNILNIVGREGPKSQSAAKEEEVTVRFGDSAAATESY